MEGRFPSHLLLSHAMECTAEECVAGCPVKALDMQSGISKSQRQIKAKAGDTKFDGIHMHAYTDKVDRIGGHNDEGGASRFFQTFRPTRESPRGDILRYLTRLITPPGGIVLDPLGNNEDLQNACQDEGFHFIGIVAEEEG